MEGKEAVTNRARGGVTDGEKGRGERGKALLY